MNTQFLTPTKQINVTNELNEAYKKSFKEEIMDKITEKLMEMLQDMVRQKVQDALKKYQDTTNKKTSEDTETSKYTHRGLQQTTQ
jgi:cation transport regulator ChaB